MFSFQEFFFFPAQTTGAVSHKLINQSIGITNRLGRTRKRVRNGKTTKNAQKNFLNEVGTTIQMAMEVCRIAPASVQILGGQSVATTVKGKSAGLTASRRR